MNKYFHEIKYFHPEGKTMPNSVYGHRGFFLNECIKFNQECALVKDLNKNKIYLADSIPVDAETNSKRLNTLNTE